MRASQVLSCVGICLVCFLLGQSVLAVSRFRSPMKALVIATITSKDGLLDQRLIEAVAAKDTEQVAHLLVSSADPNCMYSYRERVGVDDYQSAKIPVLFLA